MSDLHEKMLKDMQLRGFSLHTQRTYFNHLLRFESFFKKPAQILDSEDLRSFLLYLIATKQFSGEYVDSVYSGLKFFYEKTLGRAWNMVEVPRLKRTHKLPVALSRNEIKQLLSVTSNLKFKAMFMAAYSGGLRVSEIAHLKISDIDSENMQIFIRQGKGNLDRFTLLSKNLLDILRLYWWQYRPQDWLFPGKISGQPLSIRAIQHAFLKMRTEAGINKKATIHSLRHSFATHLLEDGTDIVRIQKLLGHANIRTTLLYLHVAKVKLLQVKSPLDSLLEEEHHES
ncbi:MAG: tyrosine-type recombinase/integrase [Bacillota bacterium]|jgi:site-specific recombinase XerD